MSGNPISRIVIVVATAAVLLAGCCSEGGSNWQKIAAGEMVNKEDVDDTNLRPGDIVYLGHDPRLIVIGDAAEVPSLRDRVLPSHLERIAEVDFSAYFVAVIHQGLHNRPYHPIEVRSVEFEDNVFTIHAKLYEPDRSTYEPFPANSPYYVLKIEKLAGVKEDVSFVLETNGERIPQICAIEGEPVFWEPLVDDPESGSFGHYEEREPQLAVVVNQDAVSAIQSTLPSRHLELITNVDFSTHFVIVVYQGQKGTTGYSVEVVSVKRQDETIIVCAQFHEPSGGGGMVISPYYVLQVEKTEELRGDLTFLLVTDSEEIARQEAVIP